MMNRPTLTRRKLRLIRASEKCTAALMHAGERALGPAASRTLLDDLARVEVDLELAQDLGVGVDNLWLRAFDLLLHEGNESLRLLRPNA